MNRVCRNECMHIVYASDDKFAEIMGISLVSLFENNSDIPDIQIYILDGGIHNDNKEKLETIFNDYGRNMPKWIHARVITEELGMSINVDRGSLSQYARLFISRDLPKSVSRILYLDCDTIVLGSLLNLYNIDLCNKTIGALKDAFSGFYRKNIDLNFKDIMFNSGVMLVDLERWRKYQVEDRLLQFIRSKHGRIQQGDQGVLNAILSKDTYCIEPRYNVVSIFFDFTYEEMIRYRKPPEFYVKNEIENAVNNPIIIHFTTSFRSIRPWIKGCKHKYVLTWIKYKNMSPWRSDPLWDDNRTVWKKILCNIFEWLPHNIAISVASFLQVYVRPCFFRIKHFLLL